MEVSTTPLALALDMNEHCKLCLEEIVLLILLSMMNV